MFVESVLNSFSKGEQNEFLKFLGRKGKKNDRRDVDVCTEILTGASRKNQNKDHAVRNRLKKDLIKFIALKQIDDDLSEQSDMLNTINMCRYLLDNRLTKEAWSYLNKLEKKANESKNYVVLDATYSLMLSYANSQYAQKVSEVIHKKTAVKQYLLEEETLLENLALAKETLHQYKTEGKTSDLASFAERLKHLIASRADQLCLHPKQLCNYIETLRSILMINKEARTLESTLISLYEQAKSSGAFSKNAHGYKLKLLYMLSHTLYRNKNYEACLKYLEEFEQDILKFNQTHFQFYFSKVVGLRSAIFFIQGDLKAAILVLETFFEKVNKISLKDNLNLHLNLAVFYAYNREFRKANRLFINFHHTDHWCEKKMGKEWVVRKNLIEMLIQYELGHDDVALSRINGIIKQSQSFDQLETDRQVMVYLKMFKRYIQDQTSVKLEDLKISFENKGESENADDEIKKLAFYCWFKARVSGYDFYETLLLHLD